MHETRGYISLKESCELSELTPFLRINWDAEPSGYAENPDNWIFLLK
jgi:hypothetical protein